MKYYFIVNPAAGTHSAEQSLRSALRDYSGSERYEVHVTCGPEDAGVFLRRVRESGKGPLRIIACGGDGTLNMVVNAAQGMEDVSIGCYACGSGNDYIKYYGETKDFLDLYRLFAAQPRDVDLMSVNGRLSVNIVDFGFDTKVVQWMERVRRLPLIGGKNAYYTGILAALLSPMSTDCKITVDGEGMDTGSLLLATLGCGQYVGGGYRCAPRSSNTDGWMEVCLVKPLSRFRLLKLMELYRQGRHLEADSLKPLIRYRRAKNVMAHFPVETGILLDGEMMMVKDAEVNLFPRALSFLVPAGL